MRTNEVGIKILEKGDVVRIGTGRVHYLVEYSSTSGMIHVKSTNTGKSRAIEVEKLTLVQSVQDAAYEAGCSVEELTEPETLDNSTRALTDYDTPVDTDDENEDEAPVVETSAYAKAVLFALNKLQKHVYAGTVSDTKKAKTRRLNGRQKASRKANR